VWLRSSYPGRFTAGIAHFAACSQGIASGGPVLLDRITALGALGERALLLPTEPSAPSPLFRGTFSAGQQLAEILQRSRTVDYQSVIDFVQFVWYDPCRTIERETLCDQAYGWSLSLDFAREAKPMGRQLRTAARANEAWRPADDEPE